MWIQSLFLKAKALGIKKSFVNHSENNLLASELRKRLFQLVIILMSSVTSHLPKAKLTEVKRNVLNLMYYPGPNNRYSRDIVIDSPKDVLL